MCTRYFMDRDETVISSIIDTALTTKLARKFQIELSKPMVTSGEVHPTDVAPVLAPNGRGERAVYPMKWGFTITVEGKQKPVVNARIETASAKPLFSDAWAKHRCIVPASWYFEWAHPKDDPGGSKKGDKYVIQPKGKFVTWLCGLYRMENGYPVFAVITKPPTEELSRIHDRMPLILPEDKIDDWISPDNDPDALIGYALTDMIAEKAPG
jgi:putative SOS response-associated peptidase YedK